MGSSLGFVLLVLPAVCSAIPRSAKAVFLVFQLLVGAFAPGLPTPSFLLLFSGRPAEGGGEGNVVKTQN